MLSALDQNPPPAYNSTIFVSGYTPDALGPGMASFELMPDGAVGQKLVESTNVVNPSFVIAGEGYLVAVEEKPSGNVVVLNPLSLGVVGRASTGGADSCHVALLEREVWVANYSSGDVSVLPLSGLLAGEKESATLVPRMLAHPGSGPVTGRQEQSHAHQVTATPWGTALIADLGADRIDEYALAGGKYALLGSAQLPPGTGPRHIALKGEYMLVAGELDGYLHVMRKTPRDHGGDYFWRWLFRSALAENQQAVDNAGEFYPSHIQLSSDGRKLYAAVRGPNTLVVLDVSGLEVSDPHELAAAQWVPSPPRFLAQVSSAGNWPRHFALSPAHGSNARIYVANQLSDNVAVFELDDNGLPRPEPLQVVDFARPSCILLA